MHAALDIDLPADGAWYDAYAWDYAWHDADDAVWSGANAPWL